ncbi:MAG: acetylxylan esterase [Muribaculaceae bacterium]|nr:acetylxylan esterase [Muribaculaceae bacterium]
MKPLSLGYLLNLLNLLTLLTLAISSSAENYPYRSDVLWVTVPDHADWLYKTGENPTVDVQLYKYGVPVDGVKLTYEIGGDMMPADSKGETLLKNGRASIKTGTMKTPGFRDLRLSADVDGTVYKHHIKLGFSPEKIEPYTEMPKDFDAFWNKNLEELSDVPLDFKMTPSPKYTTDKMDCWLVNLTVSKQGQSIYGYLFIPKDAKPGSCPIVLCPPGAGIKTIKEPLRHRYYGENGCIRFEMEIHGLNPEMTDEAFKEISKAFSGRENGYLQNGLDNKDNYYMKRVYLACVRAIDFLTTLPEWDGRNVVLQGGSQGGALAIVTAGLDKRVTACVANHPALSDMAGYKGGRAGGYPHFLRVDGMDTPEKLNTMAYYDVVNFARRVKCPVYMTWGYNDDTCPPTTSYAVYNVITSPKEALLTPINEHWTSEATERGHLDWILRHLIEN